VLLRPNIDSNGGKWVLTGAASDRQWHLVSKWTNDSKVDRKPLGSAPWLHRHAASIRSTEEELTGDEKRREELSSMVGGSHSHGLRWTAVEMANDHDF
jgi:hypothetical protein